MPTSTLRVFVLLLLAVNVFAAEPAEKAFTYKKVGDRELKLFVTMPADWKAGDHRPAIVFYHGGGWVGGNVRQFAEQAKYLASRGMVAAEVEYRVIETKEGPPTVCVQDAKSAMRWVRGHAKELGVDPDRIASSGGSAGGHLAAFVGMMDGIDDPQDDMKVSARANAMVLFNPVFDNGPDGFGYARLGDRYKEFSPFHNISSKAAPAIVFLGSKDIHLSVKRLQEFETGMKKAGVVCESRIYEGQPHSFFNYGKGDNPYYFKTLLATDEFLTGLGWLHGKPTLKVPDAK